MLETIKVVTTVAQLASSDKVNAIKGLVVYHLLEEHRVGMYREGVCLLFLANIPALKQKMDDNIHKSEALK